MPKAKRAVTAVRVPEASSAVRTAVRAPEPESAVEMAVHASEPSSAARTPGPLRVGKVGGTLLEGDYPLLLYPALASRFGVLEAVFISQLHYWLGKSGKPKDGRQWIYNSIRAWQGQFPFWHENTIRAAIARLETQRIVLSGNYNRFGFDRTKWYTLDYEALQAALPAMVEPPPSPVPSMTQELASAPPRDGRPIPETSNRDHSEPEEDAARAEKWDSICRRLGVLSGVNHVGYWKTVKEVPDVSPELERMVLELAQYNRHLRLVPGSVGRLSVAAEILAGLDLMDNSFRITLSTIDINNPDCLQNLAKEAVDWAMDIRRSYGRVGIG
jgi:hypothetical protein